MPLEPTMKDSTRAVFLLVELALLNALDFNADNLFQSLRYHKIAD